MSASTFKILKQCTMCSNMFEAQKVSTLYCSHKCNSKHYKLKLKLNKKAVAEADIMHLHLFKPKVKAIDRAMIKDKEYLSVSEIAVLFGCSRPTVYNLVNSKKIIAANIGKKKTLIKRSEIDKLFQ